MVLIVALIEALSGVAQNKSVAAGNRPDAGFNLRYDMEEGSSFSMDLTMNSSEWQNFMGNESEVNSLSRFDLLMLVLSANMNAVQIEAEYLDAFQKTANPAAEVVSDMAPLIGSKVEFLLSSRGGLSEFSGFDRLPSLDLAGGQKTMDEQQYKFLIERLFLELPEGRIGLGESWSYSKQFQEQIPGGIIDVNIDFTYTAVERIIKGGYNCLVLAGKHEISIEGQGEAGGMDFDLSLQGGGNETVHFLLEKGMYLDSEYSDIITGSIKNDELGVDAPMKVESTGTITVNFR
jgi:hypothetical protein